ncbi:hypothetical protein LEMLEM_LOCUS4740 [Lemmus lemmus]
MGPLLYRDRVIALQGGAILTPKKHMSRFQSHRSRVCRTNQFHSHHSRVCRTSRFHSGRSQVCFMSQFHSHRSQFCHVSQFHSGRSQVCHSSRFHSAIPSSATRASSTVAVPRVPCHENTSELCRSATCSGIGSRPRFPETTHVNPSRTLHSFRDLRTAALAFILRVNGNIMVVIACLESHELAILQIQKPI